MLQMGLRFGPPNSLEASELFDHVASGSLLFADDARAYNKPAAAHGLILRTVDHNKGVFLARKLLKADYAPSQRTASTALGAD